MQTKDNGIRLEMYIKMESSAQKNYLLKINTKYILFGEGKALKNSLLSHYFIKYNKGSSGGKTYDTDRSLYLKEKTRKFNVDKYKFCC